jgi:hypothetical protein
MSGDAALATCSLKMVPRRAESQTRLRTISTCSTSPVLFSNIILDFVALFVVTGFLKLLFQELCLRYLFYGHVENNL